MSGQSLKTQWQAEIVRSGLGAGPVGVGMVMSTYADADGTRVHPSMETVAKGMGCSRGYVERHCATLVEHDRLTTVAQAIPGHRGTEYRLTLERAETVGQVLQSEALEVPAKCSKQDGQVLQSVPQVLQSEPASAPNTSITMRSTMSLNHEEHHECTGVGEHAWCGIEAEPLPFEAKAAAEAEKLMASAPDFD